eukprot:3085280-Alexandrium_andersonii.AAC.1
MPCLSVWTTCGFVGSKSWASYTASTSVAHVNRLALRCVDPLWSLSSKMTQQSDLAPRITPS